MNTYIGIFCNFMFNYLQAILLSVAVLTVHLKCGMQKTVNVCTHYTATPQLSDACTFTERGKEF